MIGSLQGLSIIAAEVLDSLSSHSPQGLEGSKLKKMPEQINGNDITLKPGFDSQWGVDKHAQHAERIDKLEQSISNIQTTTETLATKDHVEQNFVPKKDFDDLKRENQDLKDLVQRIELNVKDKLTALDSDLMKEGTALGESGKTSPSTVNNPGVPGKSIDESMAGVSQSPKDQEKLGQSSGSQVQAEVFNLDKAVKEQVGPVGSKVSPQQPVESSTGEQFNTPAVDPLKKP